jgi:cytidylate kinase
MEYLGLERKAAEEFVEKADRGHQRYVREQFKAGVEDPLRYDMVINTDRISCEQAAGLIADTLLARPGGSPK